MEYFKIGKIVATHGTSGKMIMEHSLGGSINWDGTEVIFLEDGTENFIPWFLQTITVQPGDKTFITLEGITSKEEAHKFLKKEVWLKEDDFTRLVSPSAPISLLGYQIIEKSKLLGRVIEVVEQPHQTLCRIIIGQKDVWIPIHQDFLLEIDSRQKIIHVKLPEGLIDAYLQ